jgi:hypothetical protein
MRQAVGLKEKWEHGEPSFNPKLGDLWVRMKFGRRGSAALSWSKLRVCVETHIACWEVVSLIME